jgi:hypothetical protein
MQGHIEFAKVIAKTGYTTLLTYGQLLVDLIKQHHFEQFNAKA